MPTKLNLEGKKFGELTVLCFAGVSAGARSGHSRFLCQCSCGREKIIAGSNLVSGHTKSCGCKRGHPPVKDISGQRFGRLIARSRVESAVNSSRWACDCDCGGNVIVRLGGLTNGHTKSCGCLQRETGRKTILTAIAAQTKHGHARRGKQSRLHVMWGNMLTRCYNPDHHSFPWYGAKGITVCREWRESSTAFITWALANGYRDDLTIERKDNKKGYSPDNCAFTTSKKQHQNTCKNKLSEENAAEIRSLRNLCGLKGMEIAEHFGIHISMIYSIANRKSWVPEDHRIGIVEDERASEGQVA